MSCKVIQPGLQFSTIPLRSTTKSMLRLCPSHLSFNTHFSKSNFSIKTSNGSNTTRTKATTINSLYTTTQKTQSLYEVLGVPESGTLTEIKRAYKQLARKYHPDVSPPEHKEEYTRTFIRVQEAYQTLSNPDSRNLYNRDISNGLNSGRSGNISDWMNMWESQLMELKRKSNMKKNSRGMNMSWGARIRRRRSQTVC